MAAAKEKEKMSQRVTTESGEQIIIHDSGVKQDAKGRLMHGPTDPALNPVLRDPRGMQQLRQQKQARVKLRAKADNLKKRYPEMFGDVDVNSLSDELLDIAGDSFDRLVWGRVYDIFFDTENDRAASELLPKILDPPGREPEPIGGGQQITATPRALLDLIARMEEEIKTRVDQERAIDAEAE